MIEVTLKDAILASIYSEGLNKIPRMHENITASKFKITQDEFINNILELKEDNKINLNMLAGKVPEVDSMRITQTGLSYLKEKYGWI
ncbi:YjcQ family protein [Terrisporobacter petrolearius]|uniref:YjcQ family protein n=1 Tax=Terrisporobacter petrolearius TaxID=1460447 RepID=UPI0031CCCBFF